MWIGKALSCHVFVYLVVLSLVADAARLIRENGLRDNSYYYHMGDGSHAYHYNVETATSVYFKCVFAHKLKCQGRAIYRLTGRFVHSQAHNHPPDPDHVGERHFRANVLQQCEGARFVDFKDILDEARRDRRYSKRVRMNMSMRRMRSAMYARRNRAFPPIPHSLQDLTRILLDPQNASISKTIDETDNLYSGSITARDGSHHVFFFSKRMLAHMKNVKILQADGTFKARPANPPSSQIFVLTTPWDSSVVTLGWILMERRTLSAYRAVMRLLKHLCPDLNPTDIISDWEYSQQKAWEEAFPNAKIQGCVWHLCRAFIKKANKLRILRFKTALPAVMDYIKKSCAIALLPVHYYRIALNILREDAFEEDPLVAYLLHNFFNYVENNWIGNNVRREWMGFWESMHRTNNLCESHNRMLRKEVGAYRPNVYAFIAALSRMEHNSDLDVNLMKRGRAARRGRTWKSAFADRQLEALSRDLRDDLFHDRDDSIRRFLDRGKDLLQNAFHENLRLVQNRDR